VQPVTDSDKHDDSQHWSDSTMNEVQF